MKDSNGRTFRTKVLRQRTVSFIFPPTSGKIPPLPAATTGAGRNEIVRQERGASDLYLVQDSGCLVPGWRDVPWKAVVFLINKTRKLINDTPS